MILAIEYNAILDLVCHQVNNMFTLLPEERVEIEKSFDETLKAVDDNFTYSANKYFSRIIEGKKEAFFNPYHSVQWMIFLYHLSHNIYVKGPMTMVCDKIYYLNYFFYMFHCFSSMASSFSFSYSVSSFSKDSPTFIPADSLLSIAFLLYNNL